MKREKSGYLRVLSSLLFFVVLFQACFVNTSLVFASTGPEIYYTTSGRPKAGEVIEIKVNINNVSDLYGASIDFQYDPGILQVESITSGSIFGSNKIVTPLGEKGQVKTENGSQTGQASFAVSLTGDRSGISNSGNLAVIKAKVLRRGTINIKTTDSNSELSLSGSTSRIKLANSSAAKISYQAEDNKIDILESAPLTITSIETDQPSPQKVNSTIRITPNAYGEGDLKYKFWVDAGNGYEVVQDYSTKAYFDWKPTKVGVYNIWVDAMDETGAWVYKEISYIIINDELNFFYIDTDKPSPQPETRPIRILPVAFGKGELKYKFWVDDGSGYVPVQEYSTKPYYDWTPVKAGKHRIWVDVMDSTGTWLYKELDYEVLSTAMTFTSVDTSKKSPQPINTEVDITAKATGYGELLYKFWVDSGSGYEVVQDYSTKASYKWKPTKPGIYNIWVDVKDDFGHWEYKEFKYEIKDANLVMSDIKTDKASPQPIDTSIKITGNATGNGKIQYKFWIDSGNGHEVVQDYSSKDYYDWKPTKPGVYKIWVDALDETGKWKYKEISYEIKGPELIMSEIKTDKASPQPVESTIKITGSATGHGAIKYKFWIDKGNGYEVVQDYSSKNSYDWKPTKSGIYKIWVDALDEKGQWKYKEIQYEITGTDLVLSAITTDKPSPQLTNSNIRITGEATGKGPLQYKFWIDEGSGYKVVQEYSTKNTYDWKPTKPGIYDIWVDVLDASGKWVYKEIKFEVKSSKLNLVSIKTDKNSPQPLNTSIRISPEAYGDGKHEYKFWIDDGRGYEVVQEYSSKDYYDWKPTKSGLYWIWVDVLDEKGNWQYKEIEYKIN